MVGREDTCDTETDSRKSVAEIFSCRILVLCHLNQGQQYDDNETQQGLNSKAKIKQGVQGLEYG